MGIISGALLVFVTVYFKFYYNQIAAEIEEREQKLLDKQDLENNPIDDNNKTISYTNDKQTPNSDLLN